MYITELQPTDEIYGWMKVGMALQKAVLPSGVAFFHVPNKLSVIAGDDANRWLGQIQNNDKTNHVLTVYLQHTNRFQQPYGDSLIAQIPYASLQRVRLLSKTTFPAKEQNPKWPTQKAIGSQFREYKTIVEVLLKWE